MQQCGDVVDNLNNAATRTFGDKTRTRFVARLDTTENGASKMYNFMFLYAHILKYTYIKFLSCRPTNSWVYLNLLTRLRENQRGGQIAKCPRPPAICGGRSTSKASISDYITRWSGTKEHVSRTTRRWLIAGQRPAFLQRRHKGCWPSSN